MTPPFSCLHHLTPKCSFLHYVTSIVFNINTFGFLSFIDFDHFGLFFFFSFFLSSKNPFKPHFSNFSTILSTVPPTTPTSQPRSPGSVPDATPFSPLDIVGVVNGGYLFSNLFDFLFFFFFFRECRSHNRFSKTFSPSCHLFAQPCRHRSSVPQGPFSLPRHYLICM